MLYSRLGCYSWPADYCLPPRGEEEVIHPILLGHHYLGRCEMNAETYRSHWNHSQLPVDLL